MGHLLAVKPHQDAVAHRGANNVLVAVAKNIWSLTTFHNGNGHDGQQNPAEAARYLLANAERSQQFLATGSLSFRHCQ